MMKFALVTVPLTKHKDTQQNRNLQAPAAGVLSPAVLRCPGGAAAADLLSSTNHIDPPPLPAGRTAAEKRAPVASAAGFAFIQWAERASGSGQVLGKQCGSSCDVRLLLSPVRGENRGSTSSTAGQLRTCAVSVYQHFRLTFTIKVS